MQQLIRRFAVVISVASTCAVALAVTAASGVADAATRSRSGAVHAQLVSSTNHLANANASSGLGLTGPTVMFSVVALMAILAMSFLVVTFIRRRTSLG